METDDEIESWQILGPAHLVAHEDLCSWKVFKIFVIGDHIDGVAWTFEVVAPCLERLKDREEFFVVDIVVKFGTQKGVGLESDWVDLVAWEARQQNCC